MLPESMTDSACRDFDARTGERPEPPPPYTRCGGNVREAAMDLVPYQLDPARQALPGLGSAS